MHSPPQAQEVDAGPPHFLTSTWRAFKPWALPNPLSLNSSRINISSWNNVVGLSIRSDDVVSGISIR